MENLEFLIYCLTAKSIENLEVVILGFPIYCLPTHILNAFYATKPGEQGEHLPTKFWGTKVT